MTPFIILNLMAFFFYVIFFVICDGIIGKIFWTLVFCGFTYINFTKFYPEYIESEKQQQIAQEKLKNCDILRPSERIIVYHCPEYTTTNVEVTVGAKNHTETYSTTINNK